MAKITIEADPANVSDGYHTIAELYDHRCWLFVALMLSHPDRSWRSMQHHDGTSFDGWFIAGMRLPTGAISYHLPMHLWGTLYTVYAVERAPEWDGHTSADVLARIEDWTLNMAAERASREGKTP